MRLERMHEAMMEDAVSGLKEQMAEERAAVQVQIDKMAEEREVMRQERARDESDKKKRYELELEVRELKGRLLNQNIPRALFTVEKPRAEVLELVHEVTKQIGRNHKSVSCFERRRRNAFSFPPMSGTA